MSDRLTELRIENKRLKAQVQDMENKVLSVVGMINIEGSSIQANTINDAITKVINETTDQINVVTPKTDRFYSTELKKAAERGIPILVITRDRHLMDKKDQAFYDELKSANGISVINNPNVRYLLVFNSNTAVYSGGSLDKEELDKSTLIVTIIRETAKLRKLATIFSSMLPTFLRAD